MRMGVEEEADRGLPDSELEPPSTTTTQFRGRHPMPVPYFVETRPEDIARAMASKVQWSELNTKSRHFTACHHKDRCKEGCFGHQHSV